MACWEIDEFHFYYFHHFFFFFFSLSFILSLSLSLDNLFIWFFLVEIFQGLLFSCQGLPIKRRSRFFFVVFPTTRLKWTDYFWQESSETITACRITCVNLVQPSSDGIQGSLSDRIGSVSFIVNLFVRSKSNHRGHKPVAIHDLIVIYFEASVWL